MDAYVIDTLMVDLVGHDHQPSAFLVYLFLWRRTRGEGVDPAALSLRTIAEGTGLSRRGVQDALACLAQRPLIDVARESITAVPRYRVHRTRVRWMGSDEAIHRFMNEYSHWRTEVEGGRDQTLTLLTLLTLCEANR